MARILLILEDFNELQFLESILKKVGLDTMGLLNDTSLADKVMIFNPTVVVAHGRGARVSGLAIAKKMREIKTESKVVLIFPADAKPAPHEVMGVRLDAILESPLNLTRLIEVLAKTASLDAKPMLEKLEKIANSLGNAPTGWSSHTNTAMDPTQGVSRSQSSLEASQQGKARSHRMKQILAENKDFRPEQTVFDRKDLKKRQKEMSKEWDADKLAELDEERRQFTEALFNRQSNRKKKDEN